MFASKPNFLASYDGDLIMRTLRAFRIAFLLSVVTVSIAGCVTHVPLDEYTMARAAYEGAKDAEAVRYAPSLWYSTEQAYREGQRAFKERRYGAAADAFEEAKELGEKAENAARLARNQSGDILP